MENASKALLIAGSILIGMIVISLFYYMFNKVSTLVSNTDRNTLEQEIADVNKGFEAYNKKMMYGIDVINVLNKAIDNNKRNDCENDPGNDFYVNIKIDLSKKSFSILEETYIKKENSGTFEKIKTKRIGMKMTKKIYSLNNNNDYKALTTILIAGQDFKDEEGNTQTNGNGSEKKTNSEKEYTITYYPLAEFKRRIYKCSKTVYDPNTGRIQEMSFEDITPNSTYEEI